MGNLCCSIKTAEGRDEARRIRQEEERQRQLEARIQQEQERQQVLEERRQGETKRRQEQERQRQLEARIQQERERRQRLEEHRQVEAKRRQEQERQRQVEERRQTEITRRQEQERQQLEEYWQAEAQRKQLEQVNSFPTISEILENHEAVSSWTGVNPQVVRYVQLSPASAEYKKIEKQFRRTNKKFFRVFRIERVENPYLLAGYLLKKEELLGRHGFTKEELLFHGTKEQNIDNICKENLNWRLHGKGTGHIFGKGVSFTPISNYATHYCDKHSSIKVMLLMKVLVSNSCLGNSQMDIPPNGFDTSRKGNGHVIVKYYDNEFYPAYKIYFTTVGG
ncbi:hypothetical protein ILUMI_00672 [Ignelater luminosus]|uniref:Poly [ADP-ribose] polymerase n=1 Tax=Ignelater luminosus TaxID=2038154 RepID=A0A8K0GMX1_IGNLU|nr:hypothetical protein ILUMI_00672 [Ignelater luminosus]